MMQKTEKEEEEGEEEEEEGEEGEEIRSQDSPSTRDVSRVTFAALRRPAGRFRPIFSNFSLKDLPPFFDFAL